MEERLKRIRSKAERPPCIVCKIRKAHRIRINGVMQICEPCWRITGAEGTRAQYGLPPTAFTATQRADMLEVRRRAREFSLLTQIGWSVTEIAQRWGCSNPAVLSRVKRAKELGFHLPPANARHKNIDTQGMSAWVYDAAHSRGTNRHGENSGIRGCPCQPCVAVLKAKRLEYRPAEKQKRRDKRKAQDNK